MEHTPLDRDPKLPRFKKISYIYTKRSCDSATMPMSRRNGGAWRSWQLVVRMTTTPKAPGNSKGLSVMIACHTP